MAQDVEVTPVSEDEARQAAEAHRRRIPAYAIIRAMVAKDQDAAILVVDQCRQAGSLDLLAFNMAKVAADTMLACEGYDVERVLAALDHWSDLAANGVPPAQRPRGAAA